MKNNWSETEKKAPLGARCVVCDREHTTDWEGGIVKFGGVYVCSSSHNCRHCPDCEAEHKPGEIRRGLDGNSGLCPKCLKKRQASIRARTHERIVIGGKRGGTSLSRKGARLYFLAERRRVDGNVDVVEFGVLSVFSGDDEQAQRIIQWGAGLASDSNENWERARRRRGRKNPPFKVRALFREQKITTYPKNDDTWRKLHTTQSRVKFWLRARGYRILVKRNGGGESFDHVRHWDDDRKTLVQARADNWRKDTDDRLGEKHRKKINAIRDKAHEADNLACELSGVFLSGHFERDLRTLGTIERGLESQGGGK